MTGNHENFVNYYEFCSGATSFSHPVIATSGQVDASQIRDISKQGFSTVISLVPHLSQDALPDEGQIVAKNFMTYINIPVLFEDPQLDQLTAFCSFMDALKGEKVWVHCVRNTRVAAFMYAYLYYYQGFDESCCRSTLFDQWEMDETWTEFMQEAEIELKKRKVAKSPKQQTGFQEKIFIKNTDIGSVFQFLN